MDYRRARTAGGTYFFTVNLADRGADTLVRHVTALRAAMTAVRKAHPYALLAMVVLPDPLHSIWRLPAGDANYALRWALIKGSFSRSLPRNEIISASRQGKRERGIWQRRYWEHLVCFLSWLLVHLGEGGKEWLEGGQENRGINAREVFSLAFMPRKSLDAL
ncbi:hypothetical protein [Accumulibacter sp.]|uniref:REP-associated tyrosine transposase n=1 Tax=Accumulibacter sp. TaxID=2053492 RepID=UPI001ACCC585|nr:hypothetical protein [Accumulibacter sp.]MBN8455320.1 transposase [Accumulibacter sp.]MBO3708598.1 transposase [Candidatus Accumulibacter conexus]